VYPIKHVRSSVLSGSMLWRGFAWKFSPPSQGLESASLNKTCKPPFPSMFSSLSNQWSCLVTRHLGDLIAEIISNIHTNLHPHLKHITIQAKKTTSYHQLLITSHTILRSPTPEKAILTLNKPQAWRLHPRGIVINTKHTNQPNFQYKLNAKQGYTSLMIKTPSITHSFTLNFSIFAKEKLRGAPITIIISNASYHVKLLVGEFFKVWEPPHVQLPPP